MLGSGFGWIVVGFSIMMLVMVSWLNGFVIRVAITNGACRCTAVNSIHYIVRFRRSRFHSRRPGRHAIYLTGCHNPTGIKIGWRAMTHNILHHYCLPSKDSRALSLHRHPHPSLSLSLAHFEREWEFVAGGSCIRESRQGENFSFSALEVCSPSKQ